MFTAPAQSPAVYSNIVSASGTYVIPFTDLSAIARIEVTKTADNGVTQSFYLDNIKLNNLSNPSQLVAYFTPDIISSTDYYAFGAPMNGRQFNSNNYRYGFNGKENDNETVGTGQGTQDYGMRIYNPALGKFLSVDPLSNEYPWNSTYAFAENDVIRCIDLDGEEKTLPASQTGSLHHGYTTAIDNVGRGAVSDAHIKQLSSGMNYKKNLLFQGPPVKQGEIRQGGIYADPGYIATTTNMDNVASWTVPFYDVGKSKMQNQEVSNAAIGLEVLALLPVGKLFKGSAKLLKGVGGEILETFLKKVDNQATHLTQKDIQGALKDIAGTPVVINGKQYDHLKEVTEALHGLGKQIDNLNKAIGSGKLTDDVLNQATRLRDTYQAQKDIISNVLTKAKNGAKEAK